MDPTRRNILRGTAGLGLVPLLGRPAPAAPLEPTLLIRTTGGAFEAALKRNFFDPFSKASGVRVVPFAASYGDMMAKSAAMQAAEQDAVARPGGHGGGRADGVGHHLPAI